MKMLANKKKVRSFLTAILCFRKSHVTYNLTFLFIKLFSLRQSIFYAFRAKFWDFLNDEHQTEEKPDRLKWSDKGNLFGL